MNSWPKILCPALAALLLACPVWAKKPDPLDRLVPVPANEPIPVSDFFRPQLFHSPKLSPDGSHFLAVVTTRDDRSDILIHDFATEKFERLSGGTGLEVIGVHWLNNKRFIFNFARDKRYAYGLFTAELGRLNRAYPIELANVIEPIGVPRDEPLRPIIWIRQSATNRGRDGGVVQINAETEFTDDRPVETRASVVHTYPQLKGGDPVAFLSDKDDRLAFGLTSKDGITTLHRLVGKTWEKCPVDLDQIDIVDAGNQPGELIVFGPRLGENKSSPLQRLDATTGRLGEILYQDDAYDLGNPTLHRDGSNGKIRGLSYHQRTPKNVWFDPEDQRIQIALEQALPDMAVEILGCDRARKRFFVSAKSDRAPVTYYLFNHERNALTIVCRSAPWIDPKRQSSMNGLSFKTRDGVMLEGYVTLPAGASKEQPVPLVVLPHGGPWIRDTWSWNPVVQFLASRGYAVFQPNYRGSIGYGCRIPESDNWAFRKMHDDVTDGVKTLLKTGLMDRDRIAIMGGSFGGYLAICGAAYEPDLYRCAITLSGIFDWAKVMEEARSGDDVAVRYGALRRQLGDPKVDRAKFDAISPLRHVDQIKIPVYVAHGLEDRIADVAESKKLIAELKKYGVPYEKQIERDEGHGFSRLDHKVKLFTALEAFLAKNMKVRPTVAYAAP